MRMMNVLLVVTDKWNMLRRLYFINIFLCVFFTAYSQSLTFGNASIVEALKSLSDDVPKGTYCLSICDADFLYPDSVRNGIVSKLLLHSELGEPVRISERRLAESISKTVHMCDLLMLTHKWNMCNFDSILNNVSVLQPYAFETEQTIRGNVKTAFGKANKYQLHLFIPRSGLRTKYDVCGSSSFCIHELDFVDGTAINLQATTFAGNNGLLQLSVCPQYFPDISIKAFTGYAQKFSIPEFVKNKLQSALFYNKRSGAWELPELHVNGRKIVPKNRLGFMPDRAMSEDDPALEKILTMELLLSRFGLRKGTVSDQYGMIIISGAAGHVISGYFVPCCVMLDDMLLSDEDLPDVLNISPVQIKQVEYFSPGHEMFGNLAGGGGGVAITGLYGEAGKRGLLMIWTKSTDSFSRFNQNRPLSMVTVHQLGYQPPREFPMRTTVSDSLTPAPNHATVYWNPHFRFEDIYTYDFKHLTLDSKRHYLITIEGVSDGGMVINKIYRQ